MARFVSKNSLGAGWQLDFLDNEGTNTNPGFLGVLYHTNTAKRTYTFPDKDGTVAMTSDALANPMTTLGDIIAGGASGAPARLAGNLVANTKFLKSVGTAGGAAQAPGWSQVAAADLSDGVTGAGMVVMANGTSGTGNVVRVTGPTFSAAKVNFPATAAGYASMNIPTGTVPTSPVAGDLWNVSGQLYWRDASATQKVAYNPLTTLGDVVYSAAAGVATRLAGNTTTTPQFLRSTGSGGLATAPAWTGSTGSGSVVLATGPTFGAAKVNLPATAAGYASLNIPAGTVPSAPAAGDMWNVGGQLYWMDSSVTQKVAYNPMTAAGDLTIGGTSGAPARLAKATDTQVLTLVSGSPAWANASGMTSPMTALGDIIVGGASGVPARLAIGTEGHVMTSQGGGPSWAALPLVTGRYLGTKYYLASGSYVKEDTPGLAFVEVEVQGGGGTGGTSTANGSASGGGSGGYARKKILASALAASETVTVVQGTCSFGALVSATGGANGGGNNTAGGVGGDGTGGDINLSGVQGGHGAGSASAPLSGGNGGPSIFGRAGLSGNGYNVGTDAGKNSGSGGGGGGYSSRAGGAGSLGIIIVHEFA